VHDSSPSVYLLRYTAYLPPGARLDAVCAGAPGVLTGLKELNERPAHIREGSFTTECGFSRYVRLITDSDRNCKQPGAQRRWDAREGDGWIAAGSVVSQSNTLREK
jgi:hypothetical protein